MTNYRNVVKDYPVTDRPVYLTITIGEGQIGTSAVMLGNRLLKLGKVTDLLLGEGAELAGKELRIKSLVSDTNDMTNRLTISYRLTGGVKDWEGELSETVDRDGDSVIFRLKVHFLKAEEE
ncbi:MAG: hypothetical protein Kow0037_00090 [Calditrichia bacterium]